MLKKNNVTAAIEYTSSLEESSVSRLFRNLLKRESSFGKEGERISMDELYKMFSKTIFNPRWAEQNIPDNIKLEVTDDKNTFLSIMDLTDGQELKSADLVKAVVSWNAWLKGLLTKEIKLFEERYKGFHEAEQRLSFLKGYTDEADVPEEEKEQAMAVYEELERKYSHVEKMENEIYYNKRKEKFNDQITLNGTQVEVNIGSVKTVSISKQDFLDFLKELPKLYVTAKELLTEYDKVPYFSDGSFVFLMDYGRTDFSSVHGSGALHHGGSLTVNGTVPVNPTSLYELVESSLNSKQLGE